MEKEKMTEMNKMKLPYIVPTTHWVWIGLDKKIADEYIGGNGATSNPWVGPTEGWVKDEGDLGDGMYNDKDNGWPSSGGVWDNAW